MMPVWGQIILGAASVVLSISVLWGKVFRPVLRAAAVAEEVLPLLRDLTVQFRGTPHAFEILDEIVGQFRTDSGSSLRDVVDRLDQAATDNRVAAEVLKVNVAAAQQLATQDREVQAHLVVVLDRIMARVDGDATTPGDEAG